MKFAYIDESGNEDEGDVFVMAGILIDAYRLRKYTNRFDKELSTFLSRHPAAPRELKTKAFINGRSGWSQIPADERKQFLAEMCDLAVECSKIVGYGMSFQAFNGICRNGDYTLPCSKNYWALCGMFISGLIQKKTQSLLNNKGLTVLIFDDNKAHMPKVSDGLYLADSWFDGLYQKSEKMRGKTQWHTLTQNERFNQIINTAFAIKSEHSSLIQVADAVCYVYRRHLELTTQTESYGGEKEYYEDLVAKLDKERERIGRTPNTECVDFYNAIKHPTWEI